MKDIGNKEKEMGLEEKLVFVYMKDSWNKISLKGFIIIIIKIIIVMKVNGKKDLRRIRITF